MQRYRRTFWENVRWRAYGKWWQKLLRKRAKYRFRKALETAPMDAIAIDCGANVGDITEQFLRHGLKVIAYEPEPMAVELFRRRFDNSDRVTLHECAVGASSGMAELHRSDRTLGDVEYTQHSSIFPFEHLSEEPVATIPVVDIVQAIRAIEGQIYILKLDIEGSEADVLESLLNAGLMNSIDHVFVETHERFGAELKARIDALRSRIAHEGHKNVDLNWG